MCKNVSLHLKICNKHNAIHPLFYFKEITFHLQTRTLNFKNTKAISATVKGSNNFSILLNIEMKFQNVTSLNPFYVINEISRLILAVSLFRSTRHLIFCVKIIFNV